MAALPATKYVGFQNDPDEALLARVLERQKFLEKVLRFVCSAISKQGTVLKHTTHNSHMETTAELKGVHGFSFWHYGAYSMFGGERAKVWLNGTLVLDVEWWDIKECKPKTFVDSTVWQRALERLADDEIITLETAAVLRRASEEAAKRQAAEQAGRAGAARKLNEHAKRLLLT